MVCARSACVVHINVFTQNVSTCIMFARPPETCAEVRFRIASVSWLRQGRAVVNARRDDVAKKRVALIRTFRPPLPPDFQRCVDDLYIKHYEDECLVCVSFNIRAAYAFKPIIRYEALMYL